MTREDIIRKMQEAGLKAPARGEFIFIHWDQIAMLLDHERAAEREAKDELLAALQDLLMDTQHAEHQCGDKNCPVAHAKSVALKYDAIHARGQA